MAKEIQTPKAKKIHKELVIHDDVRIDDYYWLNNRKDKEVIKYLKAENAYYDAMTSKYKAFENSLFEEMKSRIKEDDESVPYKYNGYWYIVKYETGKNYPVYIRRKDTLENPDELLFDCNEMSSGHEYFKLVGLSVSPDNTMISYGIDITGRRNYILRIKSLVTDEIVSDILKKTTGSATWANDNQQLLYTKNDVKTHHSNQIYKHKHDTNLTMDKVVLHKKNDTIEVGDYKTKSKK